MEEGKEFGSGVVDVFELLASEKAGVSKAAATKLKEESDGEKSQDVDTEKQKETERPKARVGRLPGSKNSGKGPKEKITGRVDAKLKDAYIEWSLSERCTMGELIERALVEFQQRHRMQNETGKD